MSKLRTSAGALLRATRKAHGVTLREIAEDTDLTAGTISPIETGKANTTLDTIDRLFGAMGVEVELQVRGQPDPFLEEVRRLSELHPEAKPAILAMLRGFSAR